MIRPPLLLFFLLAAPCSRPVAAESEAAAARSVQEAFGKISAIVAREGRGDLDSGQIRDLDRRAQKLLEETLVRTGSAAAPSLAGIALDEDRGIKARVWAVNGLQLAGSSDSLKVLGGILSDKDEPDILRVEAASAVGDFPGSPAPRARILCGFIADESSPSKALRQALREVSLLGCPDPSVLDSLLRRWGPRPSAGIAQTELPLAFEALSHSPPVETARVLLALIGYYRRGSPERLGVIGILDKLAGELARFPREARGALSAALLEESGDSSTETRLLGMFARVEDKSSIPMLERFLDHPSPEVAAAACRDLAPLRSDKAAGRAIEGFLRRLPEDPRFGGAPGRPAPDSAYRSIRAACAGAQHIDSGIK